MEQRETRLTNPDGIGDRSVETVLTELTRDLKHLQQDLIVQLTRDVSRLQAEKTRLLDDINQLQTRYQQLSPGQQPPALNESEEERQVWVQQLAQLVAASLEERLAARVEELAARQLPPSRPLAALDEGDRLRDSVDTRFHQTYQSLSRELTNYRSDLSQSLRELDNLQQQGEALLDTLVSRLSHELQDEAQGISPTATPPAYRNGATDSVLPVSRQPDASSDDNSHGSTPIVPTPDPLESEIEVNTEVDRNEVPAPPPPKPASQVQTGLVLALLYSAVLSLFNVSIRVILNESSILGLVSWGGIISPSLGNSMLILFMRMVVVVLLMPLLAMQLYPQWWSELQTFQKPENRRLQYQVIGSGAALFISQVLIYIALGNIPAGVAITLFFIFPIVTVLGAWFLFGARPSVTRAVIMAVILVGGISAVPGIGELLSGGLAGEGLVLGSLTALGSGVTFAGYVLLTQIASKQMHPISFSFANFVCVFVFSFVGLVIVERFDETMTLPTQHLGGLFWSGIWLGLLTLISYVLNNFAIRYAGASLASIIGATGPVMTALFGFFLIGEQLAGNQIFGMLVVTAGVVALSLERMFLTSKA
ncbi:EamA family transporter [Phormidium yuhuli AB48]|uniref:EamA family transporter n=1 Tax=Phormidium yuhuli AB48 TaxID=2940671 RepID=A0ABY5AQK2_9CYAN|nr:DMT family transporter [Phormidium yuhuli]USR91498.1 EamA family transporter [Phormidium yuhuli AB48]